LLFEQCEETNAEVVAHTKRQMAAMFFVNIAAIRRLAQLWSVLCRVFRAA
jgi:hypothetical protein